MNDAVKWLYRQFVGSVPTGSAQCYLCGVPCPEQYSVMKSIADTFNSHYLAQCPSSPRLCPACSWYFDGKAGHPDFRKMSLIVWKEGWTNWQRPDMKQMIEWWLRHGTAFDYYLVVSLSKKKHILLQAPLNVQNTKYLSIQVEEQVAHIDGPTWDYIDKRFMALLQLGHNKGEILSGDLYQVTLKKHGHLYDAIDLSSELEPYRNSPELTLLSYVTIIEEKEQSIGAGHETGDDQASGTTLNSRVDMHRPGVQESLPGGNLAAIPQQRGQLRSDDQRPGQVPQPTLWDV